jgi:hypothetical protein
MEGHLLQMGSRRACSSLGKPYRPRTHVGDGILNESLAVANRSPVCPVHGRSGPCAALRLHGFFR